MFDKFKKMIIGFFVALGGILSLIFFVRNKFKNNTIGVPYNEKEIKKNNDKVISDYDDYTHKRMHIIGDEEK